MLCLENQIRKEATLSHLGRSCSLSSLFLSLSHSIARFVLMLMLMVDWILLAVQRTLRRLAVFLWQQACGQNAYASQPHSLTASQPHRNDTT